MRSKVVTVTLTVFVSMRLTLANVEALMTSVTRAVLKTVTSKSVSTASLKTATRSRAVIVTLTEHAST